jgi:hypothetical protein
MELNNKKFCSLSLIISFFGFLFFLLFPSLTFAQSISCTSCEGEWCSSSSQVGVIMNDGIMTKDYLSQVSFFCQSCTGYTLRVAFDDGYGKKYIREEGAQEDGKSLNLDFQALNPADGKILLSFELSATGQTGFQIVDSFSCSLIFDDFPEKVSNVRAFGKDKSFFVQWDKLKDKDIQNYIVYVGVYPSACSLSSVSVGPDSDSVEISKIGEQDVQNGVKYCGFVEAVDSGGKKSEPSEQFQVIPYRSFEFGRSGPPEENVGCIIAYILGADSQITNFFRGIKIVLYKLKLKFLVNLYYKISQKIIGFWQKIKLLQKIKNISFIPRAFADKLADKLAEEENQNNDNNNNNNLSGNKFHFGISFFNLKKAGIVNGESTFELAYGKNIFSLDLEYGKRIFKLVPTFIVFRFSPTYIRGKRVVLDETKGVIVSSGENYSSMIFSSSGLGLQVYGSFVAEQILVPFLGVRGIVDNFLEYYDIGGSKFGTVFGGGLEGGVLFILDMFDRRSEAILKSDYGVEDTYLFFKLEFISANIVRRAGAFFSPIKSNYFDFSTRVFSAGISLFF